MSWRNHENHKAETKAVKRALQDAGIPVTSIRHGKGTAWGWLTVFVRDITSKHLCVDPRDNNGPVREMTREERGLSPVFMQCVGNCPSCQEYRDRQKHILEIVKKVTGRHGDYDGCVNISEGGVA